MRTTHYKVHCVKTQRHPQNRKYITSIRGWRSTTAIGKVHENLVTFRHAVFEKSERTDRQTDKHTRHNTLQHSMRRGEVIRSNVLRQRTTVSRISSGTRQSALTLSDVYWRRICLRDTSACNALEVDNFMRYINLLTYLLTYGRNCTTLYDHQVGNYTLITNIFRSQN